MLTFLSQYVFPGSSTQKAFTIAPKHVVDVSKQEVLRGVRATNKDTIEVLNMTVPSRVGGFNQDYYLPFQANEPSNNAVAWVAGTDVEPKTMQMTAGAKAAKVKKSGLNRLTTGIKEVTAAATTGVDNSEELAQLRARVTELEGQLAVARSGDGSTTEDLDTMPVLGYWKIRGLGAPCRMILYYCKVDFADRLFEAGDAPDFDKTCWTDVKETMGMDYPNLPYMIDGETKITETAAIMMYIAKKWRPELMGRSAAELGRVQMLWAHVLKLKMDFTMPCYMGKSAEEVIDISRPLLAKLVEVMGESNFVGGENVTWLDFYFAECVDNLDKLSDGLFYAEFPSLQNYWDRFVALDGLAEAWADDSKLMKNPFNNKMAGLLNE